jgi:hypothetical protein
VATDLEIKEAEDRGYKACVDGDPFSSNPYGLSTAQGTPNRVLIIAWRRGFHNAEKDAGNDEPFKSKS